MEKEDNKKLDIFSDSQLDLTEDQLTPIMIRLIFIRELFGIKSEKKMNLRHSSWYC